VRVDEWFQFSSNVTDYHNDIILVTADEVDASYVPRLKDIKRLLKKTEEKRNIEGSKLYLKL